MRCDAHDEQHLRVTGTAVELAKYSYARRAKFGDRRHHVTRCVLPPPRFRLEGARSFQPAAAFGKSGQREPSAAKLSARPPLLRPPPLRPPPLSPHNSAKASSRRVGASADRLSGRGPRQHLQTSHTSHTHTTLCARISEIAEPGLLPEWQPPRDNPGTCTSYLNQAQIHEIDPLDAPCWPDSRYQPKRHLSGVYKPSGGR